MSESDKVPEVLEKIEKFNKGNLVKIRYRKLKDKYSLYLDYRKKGTKRQREFLNLYVYGKRNTREIDASSINEVVQIQRVRLNEADLENKPYQLKNKKGEANFIIFFKKKGESKPTPNTKKTWKNTLNYLIEYSGSDLKFKNVDEKFCSGFRDFLLKNVKPQSAEIYYSKLKSCLYDAVHEKIIKTNPSLSADFSKIKKTPSKREFLTESELQLLINTECTDQHVKNAFLLSCFTGLRFSDIVKLKFEDINNDHLDYVQTKTKEPTYIKLTQNALSIIEEQKTINPDSNKIFPFTNHEPVRRKILKWTKSSGIKKHITFHCARHTFATLCLTYDISIFTVSKLLGHANIKNTQIYAKLIDKKKDQAIDKLPTF